MKRIRLHLIMMTLLALVSLPGMAFADGVFYKATPTGCYCDRSGDWIPVPDASLTVVPGTRLKTDQRGWGTIAFPFGSLILRSGSEVRIDLAGIYLTRGTVKAFIRNTPEGLKFKLPHALVAVRGTIFSASADGSVDVDNGNVLVETDTGEEADLHSGQSIGDSNDRSDLPQGMEAIEKALAAEHDGDFAAAAAAFLEASQNPALAGLEDYKTHLLGQAVANIGRSGASENDPLVAKIAEAVKGCPEAWYQGNATIFATDDTKGASGLAALEGTLHPTAGKSRDTRDLIIRGLSAEMNGQTRILEKVGKELRNSGGGTPGAGTSESRTSGSRTSENGQGGSEPPPIDPFWSDAATFVSVQANQAALQAGKVRQMISPASLNRLSSKTRKKWLNAVSKLPSAFLEAQGLYFLLKALLADFRQAQAMKIYQYLLANYPSSSWTKKAGSEIDRFNAILEKQNSTRNASATRKITPISRFVGKTPGSGKGPPPPKVFNPQDDSRATGKVATPTTEVKSDSPAYSSESLQDSY